MGDLANMTDHDGRVNGFRLLRWMRCRAETYRLEQEHCSRRGLPTCAAMNRGRCDLLSEMADDLERELTPPDYPEDDGEDPAAFMGGPHDPHKRSPVADDEEPKRRCPNCLGAGEVQRTVTNRGIAYQVCQACNGTGEDCKVDGDGVDLDGPAFLGRPEQE